jgi:hypothetical protein
MKDSYSRIKEWEDDRMTDDDKQQLEIEVMQIKDLADQQSREEAEDWRGIISEQN